MFCGGTLLIFVQHSFTQFFHVLGGTYLFIPTDLETNRLAIFLLLTACWLQFPACLLALQACRLLLTACLFRFKACQLQIFTTLGPSQLKLLTGLETLQAGKCN